MPVNVDDGDHLHKCYHNEPDRTGERVKHLEPVLAGTGGEDKPNGEAERTNDAWKGYRRDRESAICCMRSSYNDPTRYIRLPNSLEDVNIENGTQHALEDTNLRTEPKR